MGIRKHKVKEAEVKALTQTFILKSDGTAKIDMWVWKNLP